MHEIDLSFIEIVCSHLITANEMSFRTIVRNLKIPVQEKKISPVGRNDKIHVIPVIRIYTLMKCSSEQKHIQIQGVSR